MMPLLLWLVGCFVVGPDAWDARLDADADGVLDAAFAEPGQGDCDDLDPLVGAPTLLYPDEDGDGFGDDDAAETRCDAPASWLPDGGDCDDSDEAVHPDAPERCNEVDDDCDGAVDADDPDDLAPSEAHWYEDADADGFGAGPVTIDCEAFEGYVLGDGDCAATDPLVHPNALEICDTIDNDCDGQIDDTDNDVIGATVWYADTDGDGFGRIDVARYACFPPVDFSEVAGDCDDTTDAAHPDAPEICDGIDNDCDEAVDDDDDSVEDQNDWYADTDGDGWGVGDSLGFRCFGVTGEAPDVGDCAPDDASISPGATETWYDGVDQDCGGEDDYDQDGDGHLRTVDGGDDCDDTDAQAYTGAPELWYDGIDQACDGGDDYDRDGDGVRAVEGGGTDCDDLDDDVDLLSAAVPGEIADIQTALDRACAGARIEVAAGTYDGPLVIARGVELVGAGPGVSILDGGGSSRPLSIGGGASGTLIEGWTIRGGASDLGAGLRASALTTGVGTVTLRDLEFTGNAASNFGGAIFLGGWAQATLDSIEVHGNSAVSGGGLAASGVDELMMTGVDFHDNTAENRGGGANVEGSTLTIEASRFVDNELTGPVSQGAGVAMANIETAFLYDVVFTGNIATGFGGGLRVDSASGIDLERVFFAGNDSLFGGGVSISSALAVSIRNAVFADHETNALSLSNCSDLDVSYATFAGNDSWSNAGALLLTSTPARITDTLLISNSATGGGALVVNNDAGVEVNLQRVAGFDNTDADIVGSTETTTWSDDPLFVDFDSSANWSTWDLHLGTGSPYLTVSADSGPLGAFGGGGADWSP